jgi:hypothetical protein
MMAMYVQSCVTAKFVHVIEKRNARYNFKRIRQN